MSSAVDQVATVVLYSNDSYVKSVAIEEPGYVIVLWFHHTPLHVIDCTCICVNKLQF